MSITRVQANQNTAASLVTTVTVTLASGVTLGNLIVVCMSWGIATESVTPPDGSWANGALLNGATGIQSSSIYYLVVDAAHAGQTSWTWTVSTAAKIAITVVEWNSSNGWSAPLDQSATNSNSSAKATVIDSGTTPTTTQAEELWVASLAYGQSSQTESALTSGWSFGEESTISLAHTTREAYNVATATGAANCNFTIGTSEVWGGCIATFKDKGAVVVAHYYQYIQGHHPAGGQI